MLIKKLGSCRKYKSKKNETLARDGSVYSTHDEAEDALKKIQESGCDMQKISIVGNGSQSRQSIIGFYNFRQRMWSWAKQGMIWGALWGFLLGSSVFLFPGLGSLVIVETLVSAFLSVAEGAVIVGSLGAFGAVLYGFNIPKNTVYEFETATQPAQFAIHRS